MTPERLEQVLGVVVPCNDLTTRGARAAATAAQRMPFVRLLECRRSHGAIFEAVLVELDVEVGQRRHFEILPTEAFALIFCHVETGPPRVLAMRDDFPVVPHLNLEPFDIPRSICLYDEPWEELRLDWTAPKFIERLRWWLSMTAKGTLHADDQPLEPLLAEMNLTHILIAPINAAAEEAALTPILLANPYSNVLVPIPGEMVAPEHFAVVLQAEACTHGHIRKFPTNMNDLAAQFQLRRGALLEIIKALAEAEVRLHGLVPVFVVAVPMRRSRDVAPEHTQYYGFMCDRTLAGIGEALGISDIWEGRVIRLINLYTPEKARELALSAVKVLRMLDETQAAVFSGVPSPPRTSVTAIGVGALGSQVVSTLVRMGVGEWTIVDDDALLPHNLVRHLCGGHFVGFSKAASVAATLNATVPGAPPVKYLCSNVLSDIATNADLQNAMLSDVLLDMSASIAVARYLAVSVPGAARRMSAFMTPSGEGAVLLAEDAVRDVRLDSVEMQFYRFLLSDSGLEGLLKQAEGVRYATSCRSASNTLAQDMVAVFCGLCSRGILDALKSPEPRAIVWVRDVGSYGVSARTFVPCRTVVTHVGDWTVVSDEGFIQKLRVLRGARLPRETGGVVLGAVDLTRLIVYAVDTITSPPDSEEWPTSYVRGCVGLAGAVEKAQTVSGNQLSYVGEWHSHPDGSSTAMSRLDVVALGYISERTQEIGLPALMVIVGEGEGIEWFVQPPGTPETPGIPGSRG